MPLDLPQGHHPGFLSDVATLSGQGGQDAQRIPRDHDRLPETVGRVETRGAERRKRRALTPDEVRRLLAVAGRYRIVYLAALFTGLRRDEIAQCIWARVHLDAPNPYIDVPAALRSEEHTSELQSLRH